MRIGVVFGFVVVWMGLSNLVAHYYGTVGEATTTIMMGLFIIAVELSERRGE